MARDPKYIIFDNGLDEYAVLFPNPIYHKVGAMASTGEIVAAGFYSYQDGRLECYGGSTGLGIRSRGEEDAKVIRRTLNL